MRDPSGHLVHYDPGEPPDWDEPDPHPQSTPEVPGQEIPPHAFRGLVTAIGCGQCGGLRDSPWHSARGHESGGAEGFYGGGLLANQESGGGEGEEDIDEVIGRAIAEQRAKRPPPKRYVMVDPDKLAALTQRAEAAEQERGQIVVEMMTARTERDQLRAENQRLRENVERLLRQPDDSVTMTTAEYDAMAAEIRRLHGQSDMLTNILERKTEELQRLREVLQGIADPHNPAHSGYSRQIACAVLQDSTATTREEP